MQSPQWAAEASYYKAYVPSILVKFSKDSVMSVRAKIWGFHMTFFLHVLGEPMLEK